MEKDNELIGRLLSCFGRSFINEAGEFICLLDYRNEDVNSYFRLDNVSNELELKCKVLEYLSRPAFKGFTYEGQNWKEKQIGEEIYEYHLDGINYFLETKFSNADIEIIYTKLGNGCNRKLCIDFIESGYDMKLLRGE